MKSPLYSDFEIEKYINYPIRLTNTPLNISFGDYIESLSAYCDGWYQIINSKTNNVKVTFIKQVWSAEYYGNIGTYIFTIGI